VLWTNTFGDYILARIPAIIMTNPMKSITRVRPLDLIPDHKHRNTVRKPGPQRSGSSSSRSPRS
jgi:hypothetical protein